ncbi:MULTISPECIES: toluene-4-monooxygenase system B family protein [Protofrankia]|uniref:Toluene monooxygenase n=1 Tax=Protofrankia coriariae TaxID=1562887 RepID=A0ABR5F776_9ACTN|nr:MULTISPECIES: toluene-4-monooxygenase system B family protein [Protofrankia]KLL12576.1 toluene monooxygenase [Protofrankia coriariae]ONH36686.1 toluene monooxygenase [Protofrankia sp. BMG5.30]
MALLPLSGTFLGDVTTVGVVVDDEDTAEAVGQKIAHHAVGRRVAARTAPIRVRLGGRVLDPDEIIGRTGVSPYDHVEVFFDE